MTKPSPNKKLISLKRQPIVLLISSSVLFLLILCRLIFLQILNYESFKKMSDDINSLKEDFQEIKSILMQLVNNIDK